MIKWKTYLENSNKSKLKDIIKSDAFIMYFKFDKEIFGADEDSRVVFAKLKSPDEDVTKAWESEASFMGSNLSSYEKTGHLAKRIFFFKDMKNIKIITKEKVLKELC